MDVDASFSNSVEVGGSLGQEISSPPASFKDQVPVVSLLLCSFWMLPPSVTAMNTFQPIWRGKEKGEDGQPVFHIMKTKTFSPLLLFIFPYSEFSHTVQASWKLGNVIFYLNDHMPSWISITLSGRDWLAIQQTLFLTFTHSLWKREKQIVDVGQFLVWNVLHYLLSDKKMSSYHLRKDGRKPT